MVEKFKDRLNKACDDSPHIPPHGKGRQMVIKDRLKVSQEAVRKWFADEAKPRPRKMEELAEFLGVDQAWLALGIKPEMSADQKKLAGRATEGAVLVVAGMIQLQGGNCAFPSPTDPRASYVDIYAIVKGIKYDLHVSTAKEVSEDSFEVIVPREFKDVRCLGCMPAKGTPFNLIDLPVDLIDKHKSRRAGDFLIPISKTDNVYHSGDDIWPRLKFGNLFI